MCIRDRRSGATIEGFALAPSRSVTHTHSASAVQVLPHVLVIRLASGIPMPFDRLVTALAPDPHNLKMVDGLVGTEDHLANGSLSTSSSPSDTPQPSRCESATREGGQRPLIFAISLP